MTLAQLSLFTCILIWYSVSARVTADGSPGSENRPHILLIIADDLGFNDLSFRGSRQIPTPNIDALAFSGIILNNYYVSPICTPSRSALFSGMHPIHTGMQHTVIFGSTPYGFPLEIKLLPEYLKELGYATHLVGKWHLGHFRKTYTPTCRGFDTHYGHWTGHKDYYDNTAQEESPQAIGYDMRRNLDTSYENFGNYTTDLFTAESVKLIQNHDPSKPLFLTISHTAVHSANPYSYLQAPAEVLEKFSAIRDPERRKYAGMVYKLDESCGVVIKAMADAGFLQNLVLVFTSDNGGPAAGFNNNAASNWPLRSVKNTLWEGGVRSAGLIWSPLLSSSSRVFNGIIHIQDWLPTILDAVGGAELIRNKIDGISQWNSLKTGKPSRQEILHNIDDIYGNEAIRVGDWKLLHGTTYGGKWDGWYGPSGRDDEKLDYSAKYDSFISSAASSYSGIAIKSSFPKAFDKWKGSRTSKSIWKEVVVNCLSIGSSSSRSTLPPADKDCNLTSGEYCLFNIIKDPCELENSAIDHPEIVNELYVKLQKYKKSMVPPLNRPKDPRGHPKHWGFVWTNFIDFLEPEVSTKC